MPVYLAMETRGIVSAWPILTIAVAGVVFGTFWGVRLLRRIPDSTFRRILSTLILGLGVYMLVHAIGTNA